MLTKEQIREKFENFEIGETPNDLVKWVVDNWEDMTGLTKEHMLPGLKWHDNVVYLANDVAGVGLKEFDRAWFDRWYNWDEDDWINH